MSYLEHVIPSGEKHIPSVEHIIPIGVKHTSFVEQPKIFSVKHSTPLKQVNTSVEQAYLSRKQDFTSVEHSISFVEQVIPKADQTNQLAEEIDFNVNVPNVCTCKLAQNKSVCKETLPPSYTEGRDALRLLTLR